jgi:hypothetical protein
MQMTPKIYPKEIAQRNNYFYELICSSKNVNRSSFMTDADFHNRIENYFKLGGDANAKSTTQRTILDLAIERKDIASIELLAANGAHLFEKDRSSGYSAVEFAAQNFHVEPKFFQAILSGLGIKWALILANEQSN